MNSRPVFLGILAIVFAASAAMTIALGAPMSAMGSMEMPGGWSMSMMWMPIPGQGWLGAAESFVVMWVVMMVAMMLPSLTPALGRYRESLGATGPGRVARLTALVAAGYFVVWALLGALVFPIGVALAHVAMSHPAFARSVPVVVGAIVLLAGMLQHTRWKARQLAFCRGAMSRYLTPMASDRAALRHGWCLGLHCVQSCLGITAAALAAGVMDLRVMTLVAAAITAERLARDGVAVARAIGVVGVAIGLVMMVRLA